MKRILVDNIPDEMHEWLKEKAKDAGIGVTSFLKVLVKYEMKKDKKK